MMVTLIMIALENLPCLGRNVMLGKSRRTFLKETLALGALVTLAGRSALSQDVKPAIAATEKLIPPVKTDLPKMTIAQWKPPVGMPSADEPVLDLIAEQLTNEAITNLGGMKRFVKTGDVVWVKPNIGWNRGPEQAANTHPAVVAALVKMCFDAGAAKVKVGDNPCGRPQDCYENSGIAPAAKALGAEIVYMDRKRFLDHKIGGNRVDTIPVYPDVMDCDLVINVPVVKHHSGATVTICMKNYMGVIEKRGVFHQDLATCIADMAAFMKPQLCVVDATRILTAHGPSGGDLADVKRMNYVAAGTDIVALDAFGSELLGHKPMDIGSVAKGVEYGLGTADYKSLNPKMIVLPG